MPLSVIELENMEFHAFHGCYELEQVVGNRFLVSIVIEANLREAAYTDSVDDTVNYLSVYQAVEREMKITSHILENVASRIIDAVYDVSPLCRKVTVKVSKLAPPLGGKIERASVTLSR